MTTITGKLSTWFSQIFLPPSNTNKSLERALRVSVFIYLVAFFFLPGNGAVNAAYLGLIGPLMLVVIYVERHTLPVVLIAVALLFAAYMALSSLWSSAADSKDTIRLIKYVLIYFVPLMVCGFYLAKSFRSQEQIAFLTLGLVLFYVSINVLISFLNEKPVYPRIRLFLRLDSVTLVANLIASYSVICLVYLIRRRLFALAIVLLLAALVLVSPLQSRSAIAGLSLGLLMIGLIEPSARRAKQLLFVLVIIWAAGLFALELFNAGLTARGFSYRTDIWNHVLSTLGQCGIWEGCGLHPKLRLQLDGPNFFVHHPHNIFLTVLYTGGIIGLTLFCALIARALMGGWQARSPWLYGLVCALATLMFDGNQVLASPTKIMTILLYFPLFICLFSKATMRKHPGCST